jgi:iron complex outermembrane receptor protein
MYGTYGTSRFGTQLGGQNGAVNYIADWSKFHTDGWRDHSIADREQFNAKFKWKQSEDARLSLVLNSVGQGDTQDPLGITRAQVAANPRQVDPVATRFNTRKTNRQEQAGITYDKRIDAGNNLRFSAYAGDRQVRQYQAIPVANAATYSGGVVDLQRYFGGGSVNWVHDGSLFGRPFSATVGAEQEMMNDRRRGFDNNSGVMGTLRRDEDNRIEATNAFAQADWRFAERASASLGLRTTRVGVELKDYFITAANPNDSGRVVFANTSPVAGLTYRVTPELSAYGSVGRGFETPTFSELAYRTGGTGMNTALKPGRNTNYELGLKGRIAADHRLSIARFETRTRDEIVTDISTGGRSIFKNASKTERSGWEAGWNAVLPAGFDSYLAYTVVDAKYSEAFVSGTSPPVAAGNRIPGVPRTSVYAELRWQHLPAGFTTAFEARHASQVFVDDQNSDSTAAYTVTNLRFSLEQKASDWRITETFRVDNLANTNYIGSVIVADSNSRFFETAPRRGVAFIINGKLAF